MNTIMIIVVVMHPPIHGVFAFFWQVIFQGSERQALDVDKARNAEVEMCEVLYNACYGGFSVSAQFSKEFEARYGEAHPRILSSRTDPRILSLFHEKGRFAGGSALSERGRETELSCAPNSFLSYPPVSSAWIVVSSA
eukprot:m.74719 g.74719  ORF g.74719 m.74719 type:complete len:138 (+) comp13945_c0_seq1:247-660(+)